MSKNKVQALKLANWIRQSHNQSGVRHLINMTKKSNHAFHDTTYNMTRLNIIQLGLPSVGLIQVNGTKFSNKRTQHILYTRSELEKDS
jgi:hypothetical protein